MAGLSIRTGLSGRFSTATASTANTGSVDMAAFAPGATQAPETKAGALTPDDPVGIALWVGVAALAGLVFIRWTLPR